MPSLILIAGPNGAGKTTFANRFLTGERSHVAFVNADEIAFELAKQGASAATDFQAARLMLLRLDELIGAGRNAVAETTLATRTYAAKIPRWQELGYAITLFYLRLHNADAAVQRVRRRVKAGGHGIQEAAIRRRFDRSLLYLETLYKPIVDQWYVWDSVEGGFSLSETWEKTEN